MRTWLKIVSPVTAGILLSSLATTIVFANSSMVQGPAKAVRETVKKAQPQVPPQFTEVPEASWTGRILPLRLRDFASYLGTSDSVQTISSSFG